MLKIPFKSSADPVFFSAYTLAKDNWKGMPPVTSLPFILYLNKFEALDLLISALSKALTF